MGEGRIHGCATLLEAAKGHLGAVGERGVCSEGLVVAKVSQVLPVVRWAAPVLTLPGPACGALTRRSWWWVRSRSTCASKFLAPLDGPHMLSAMLTKKTSVGETASRWECG